MYCSNSSKGEISVSYELGFPSKSQVTHQTLLFVFSSCRWRQVKLHSTIVQSEILFWSENKGCPSRLVSYSCMGYPWIIFWWNVAVSWMKNVIFHEKNDMQFVRSLYAVCMQFICSFETTYSFGKTTYTFVKTVCSFKTAYKLHIVVLQIFGQNYKLSDEKWFTFDLTCEDTSWECGSMDSTSKPAGPSL